MAAAVQNRGKVACRAALLQIRDRFARSKGLQMRETVADLPKGCEKEGVVLRGEMAAVVLCVVAASLALALVMARTLGRWGFDVA